MGIADPDQPTGHWIDAKESFYIVGGDVTGPHGEAFVPFLDLEDAGYYVKEHGGKIIKFDDVTPDMLRPSVHKMHEHSK